MPSPAQTFQGIAGPQDGPFSQFLQPRPIDTLPPAGQQATGWESGPVGAGQVALGFLQGVRQNRLASALEEDKNTQSQLDNFRQHVNAQLQNPDLTEEGRQAILAKGNEIMNQHMHYEMRDVPKDGVAGFFKNLLVNASGGPIKTRDPINWHEATGQITNGIRPEHSQKYNYQTQLNAATAAIQQLKESGQTVMPSQINQALAPILSNVAMTAPNYVGVFQSTIKDLLPGDPYQEEMMRRKIQTLRAMNGSGGAAPATAPPPAMDGGYSPVAGATPVAAPAAQVRPADSGTGAMDLRDPINRGVLKDLGYKVDEPGTIYNPADMTQYAAGAIRHPQTGAWHDYQTMARLPDNMQQWVPSDQLKTPSVSQDAVVAGSTVPGAPTQLFTGRRATGASSPMTYNGLPLYGTTVDAETISPTGGRVYAARTPGLAVPPPAENPGEAHRRAVDSAALTLRSKAAAAAGPDKAKQWEWIKANTPADEISGRAIELIGDVGKASAAEEFIKMMSGGAPATPPATTPPPSSQRAPVAPPAAEVPPSQRNRAK